MLAALHALWIRPPLGVEFLEGLSSQAPSIRAGSTLPLQGGVRISQRSALMRIHSHANLIGSCLGFRVLSRSLRSLLGRSLRSLAFSFLVLRTRSSVSAALDLRPDLISRACARDPRSALRSTCGMSRSLRSLALSFLVLRTRSSVFAALDLRHVLAHAVLGLRCARPAAISPLCSAALRSAVSLMTSLAALTRTAAHLVGGGVFCSLGAFLRCAPLRCLTIHLARCAHSVCGTSCRLWRVLALTRCASIET